MRTEVLAKIPNLHSAGAVTGDQLPLVWMDHDIVDGTLVIIDPLDASVLGVPHFDEAILGAGHDPLPFTMELHTSDVPGMAGEGHDRLRIGRLDVEKLYIVIACGSEKPFVWGNAESIDLRVRMLDGPRANS